MVEVEEDLHMNSRNVGTVVVNDHTQPVLLLVKSADIARK